MHPIKTFIIEDSPLILDSLIATLEELAPVKVVGTAGDEFAAVKWINDPGNLCDLLIVDVFLKEGSGLGVLRSILASAKRHKIVVLSNYATEEIRRKSFELGADRVFDKSNEIDSLISYCRELPQH
jgi:DNA-binding NarL/FixJ family response regulator